MGTIVIRAVIVYALILIVFRLMGKRQIGQMQPFELVLTLIIADLSTIPMSEIEIPILHGVVPLLTLFVLHFIITIVSQKSTKLDRVINGKPVIIYSPTGIDYKALKSLSISVEDVLEGIRGKGFFSLDEVSYVIVETTGQINVMAAPSNCPVSRKDLNLEFDKATLPITLISEGSIMKENMGVAGVDQDFIMRTIKKADINRVKDCLIFTLDKNGRAFIQGFNKQFQTLQLNDGSDIKI